LLYFFNLTTNFWFKFIRRYSLIFWNLSSLDFIRGYYLKLVFLIIFVELCLEHSFINPLRFRKGFSIFSVNFGETNFVLFIHLFLFITSIISEYSLFHLSFAETKTCLKSLLARCFNLMILCCENYHLSNHLNHFEKLSCNEMLILLYQLLIKKVFQFKKQNHGLSSL